MPSLGDFIKKVIMDTETKEIEMGKIRIELADEFTVHQDAHAAEHAEIERKVEAYEAKLKAEHKPSCIAYKRKHQELWNRALTELGVPEDEWDELYELDPVNGTVTKRVELDEDDQPVH